MDAEQAGLALCVVACLVSGRYLTHPGCAGLDEKKKIDYDYATTASSSAAEGCHRAKQARQRQGMGLLLDRRVLGGLEMFCCVLVCIPQPEWLSSLMPQAVLWPTSKAAGPTTSWVAWFWVATATER